jgi:hypothetical protein
LGGARVKIYYDDRADLWYLRFDERKQELMNRRVAEDVVLDTTLLPVQFEPLKSA